MCVGINMNYSLKLLISTHNIFHNSEFSYDPSSFIGENETISVRDPWYTWPENRLVDSWKFVAAPILVDRRFVDFDVSKRQSTSKSTNLRANRTVMRCKLPGVWGVYESILRSSVPRVGPRVTTWDILILADERERIVWKFPWGGGS